MPPADDFLLGCTVCEARHPAGMTTLGCRECAAPLQVVYDGGATAGGEPPLPLRRAESRSLLPPRETPLIALPTLGAELGVARLSAKLEFESLTGSFKDRGSSVMLAVAVESGVTELVEDSSGNAGASVAAFSARTGVRAHVFAPASAPAAKLKQIAVYGASVHAVDGTRDETAQAAVDFHRERGIVYASHALSPYFLEGTKTFAYEVFRQIGGRASRCTSSSRSATARCCWGHTRGSASFCGAGLVSDVPKLHCVQTEAVRPIAAAAAGEVWSAAEAGKTVAGGIAVASPPRLRQIVDAVAASGGAAVTVDEASIATWQRKLAAREGVFAEPTSAAAFAGLARLVAQGDIGPEDSPCSCRSPAPAPRTAPRSTAVPAGGALCRLNGPSIRENPSQLSR